MEQVLGLLYLCGRPEEAPGFCPSFTWEVNQYMEDVWLCLRLSVTLSNKSIKYKSYKNAHHPFRTHLGK